MPIHAIRVGDNIVADEKSKLCALGDAWAKTFAQDKPIDETLAENVAIRFASKIEIPDFAPPSSAFIGFFLRRAQDSAPGVDGIPYSAWFRSGPDGWRLLHQVAVWLCAGLGMLMDFNDTFIDFVAKGFEDDDHINIIRETSASRPLGLKNCDVKAVSGATHDLVKRPTAAKASRLQRGFLQGRNFLNNVVDLERTHGFIR